MPIIRDGKTYYTINEVDEKLKVSIRENAKQVSKEIKSRIVSNENIYV